MLIFKLQTNISKFLWYTLLLKKNNNNWQGNKQTKKKKNVEVS